MMKYLKETYWGPHSKSAVAIRSLVFLEMAIVQAVNLMLVIILYVQV